MRGETRVGHRHVSCRMLQIESLIKSGKRYGLKELAEYFEVSPRTIQRDLEAMRERLGAPVVYDRFRGGFYYERNFSLPRPEFSEGELIALFMTEKLVSCLEGTPYAAGLVSAAGKLRLLLTDGGKIGPERDFDFISIAGDPLRGNELEVGRVFAGLETARRYGRRVEITHFSVQHNRLTRRLLDPYHLYLWRGTWYVIGFCHLRGEVRIFALDRIGETRETGESFRVPEDFRIEDYLKSSWGIERGEPVRVKIRFDPRQAGWIREREWHPSQRLTEVEDGGLLFEVEVMGLREIKQWVMGFGALAEVLEPAELREEIGEEVRRMGIKYGLKQDSQD